MNKIVVPSTTVMGYKLVYILTSWMALNVIDTTCGLCPIDPNCVCENTLAVELNCNIDGHNVTINMLPNTYINIRCDESEANLNYNRLPKYANSNASFKSVSFKDCPIPDTSFKSILEHMGVSKTMALIFQNAKNLTGSFERKHFTGLKNLTKLLLSIKGVKKLPDNLFTDLSGLTWLNIRSNSINLSEELFKPLERLETLEISHNHMTNISSNLFSHLLFLRKLSLWQSNVTWFSEDFFTGVDVLEELDLSSNGLNELPASIFKPLRKLKKLTLLSNKFSSLPVNLFRVNDELETVVILNNDVKLVRLPTDLFGNLPKLKLVYIQRCGLELLPHEMFANSSSITNISLAHNDIEILSESIFNDQINLIELDLSYNKIVKLEDKLFSSLVRLEKLDLSFNALETITESTFSSLLSLIYLSLDHNVLRTIPDYLLYNNKQSMSISLAYNKLNFDDRVQNDTWAFKSSPLYHLFNLKLLNLSHNEIKLTFIDWWQNHHDVLDISYNFIQLLWPTNRYNTEPLLRRTLEAFVVKPSREIWISHNPLECMWRNFEFLDFLSDTMQTRVVDKDMFECYREYGTRHAIARSFLVYFLPVLLLLTLLIIFLIFFGQHIKHIIYSFLKKYLHIYIFDSNLKHMRDITVKYSEKDEEFVHAEIFPKLQSIEGVKDATVIVFSSNFITSCYNGIDVEKIHSEISNAKDIIYIFVDIGPEIPTYAFLKEKRDSHTSILWDEPYFWDTLSKMLSFHKSKTRLDRIEYGIDIDLFYKSYQKQNPKRSSLNKLDDHLESYAYNDYTHSQV